MNIQISEHFTYGKLLRFTLPSIVMMVFSSIYGVVDGVFVSNFVGAEAFAAVNLIMPFLMILGAVGFMLGTGGSALVSFTLGTGDERRANEIFSMLIYVLLAIGAVFTIGGILLMEKSLITGVPASEVLHGSLMNRPASIIFTFSQRNNQI